MNTLHVSHDCGCTYQQRAQSDSVDDLLKLAPKPEETLRWYIEDDAGKLVEVSPIHKEIAALMCAIRDHGNGEGR